MSETRALRKWLDEQLARGCLPADLIDSMITVGHQPAAARQHLEEALRRRAANQGEPVASAGTASVLSRLATPAPLKDPLAAGRSVVTTPDRDVSVLLSLTRPRVILFGGVLDDQECDAIVDASRARLQRSHTIDRQSGATQLHAARTSEGCHFNHADSPLFERVNQRIAALTAWPLDHGEPLQILHYGVGAEYEPHYDYFDPVDPGTATLTAIGGQRVATLILYLNTPAAGGATIFPELGIEVAAIKGNALFFAYDAPHPDTLSLHAGTPVTAGEKWIATRWMRERPYRR